MKNQPPMIVTDDSLTVFLNGKTFSARNGQANFHRAMHYVSTGDWDSLKALLDVPETIVKLSSGKVKLLGDLVTYNGEIVGGVIAQRIISLANKGLTIEPICRLLDNLMQNPDEHTRNEFYEWLEKGQMPITEDGCFLAYRRVDKNYLSYNANPDGSRNRNRIGDVVRMKREDCNPDRTQTCSRGLHFCSFGYLPSYYSGNGRVMVVKVNPKNVVAFPQDYNCTKGRCCEYEVVAEHFGKENTHALVAPLYDSKNRNPNPVKIWTKRDANGRFISRKQWQWQRKQVAKGFKRLKKSSQKRDASGRFVAVR